MKEKVTRGRERGDVERGDATCKSCKDRIHVRFPSQGRWFSSNPLFSFLTRHLHRVFSTPQQSFSISFSCFIQNICLQLTLRSLITNINFFTFTFTLNYPYLLPFFSFSQINLLNCHLSIIGFFQK